MASKVAGTMCPLLLHHSMDIADKRATIEINKESPTLYLRKRRTSQLVKSSMRGFHGQI